MPEWNMRHFSQGNAECLSGMCIAIDIANIELLLLEQEWMFSRRCVVLFAAGEKYVGLQKRLSRNEVAALSEAELIRLIHFQLGSPWV